VGYEPSVAANDKDVPKTEQNSIIRSDHPKFDQNHGCCICEIDPEGSVQFPKCCPQKEQLLYIKTVPEDAVEAMERFEKSATEMSNKARVLRA
jgi:hypothetical protein